ncbi:hypothetical protein Leryth_024155, partial [Lithospermum erythrorhizon]
MSIRIRFVTCPTCREILPELPGIPLYKCGRCSTMLRAKDDNIGSASEANPTKKHGHRNEQQPANEEHTEGAKGDESMNLLRENNREGNNEFPVQILKSSPNTDSVAMVEGHKDERSLMVEKKDKLLDENNATHLGVSLSLEEGNATNADLGTLNQSMLTESIAKDDEYFKETQKKVHNFSPSSSEENLEILPDNPRSSIGLMSKSPTKIYYASDARQTKGAGNISADTPRVKDSLRFKKMQKDQLRIANEPISSSTTKVNRDFISKAGDWKQHYKLPEARKHDSLARNMMGKGNNDSDRHGMDHMSRSSQRPHGNGSPSSIRLNVNMSRSSQLPRGNRNPSSIRLNVSQQHPEPHLTNSTFYEDPDKMELLNKVYELEEKLNQTQISEQMRDRRFNVRGFGEDEDSAKRHNAYANVKHSGHHGNHPQGLWCKHNPEIAGEAFSGDATRCRNQMDCVCPHCCHQCWHHATKTCSHCILCQHAVYPRKNYDNEHPSCSPSRQARSNDKFSSQVLERNSDNQLQKKKDMRKLRLREKYQIVRRHLR